MRRTTILMSSRTPADVRECSSTPRPRGPFTSCSVSTSLLPYFAIAAARAMAQLFIVTSSLTPRKVDDRILLKPSPIPSSDRLRQAPEPSLQILADSSKGSEGLRVRQITGGNIPGIPLSLNGLRYRDQHSLSSGFVNFKSLTLTFHTENGECSVCPMLLAHTTALTSAERNWAQ